MFTSDDLDIINKVIDNFYETEGARYLFFKILAISTRPEFNDNDFLIENNISSDLKHKILVYGNFALLIMKNLKSFTFKHLEGFSHFIISYCEEKNYPKGLYSSLEFYISKRRKFDNQEDLINFFVNILLNIQLIEIKNIHVKSFTPERIMKLSEKFFNTLTARIHEEYSNIPEEEIIVINKSEHDKTISKLLTTPTIINSFSEETRNIINSSHLYDKSGQLWNLTPAVRYDKPIIFLESLDEDDIDSTEILSDNFLYESMEEAEKILLDDSIYGLILAVKFKEEDKDFGYQLDFHCEDNCLGYAILIEKSRLSEIQN